MDFIEQIITHEVGHWTVARTLGYEGNIHMQDNQHFFYVPTTHPSVDTIEGCTQGVLIALGGKAAENIMGMPTSAGFLQDLHLALGYLRTIAEKTGEPLPYQKIGSLPYEVYEPYLKQSEQILQQAGGVNLLRLYTGHALDQIQNLK